MEYTKLFRDLNKNDSDIAGGKGASLGEMLNVGIPVPDGYVVLSTTFDVFLKKSELLEDIDAILEKVNHKAVHSVDEASEKIQELIKHAKMPDDIAKEIEQNFKNLGSKFVAVRSSATAEDGADHAWAGQLDSYLNTTEKDLIEKVQHCWASLFTPRAIFYRFEKGLDTTKISVAVVVQKMVNSEKSGIAFSVHPVTEDRNQLIIEAGFGLGEAIVSGSVTPDSYVIEKEPRKIIDVFFSEQTRALYRKEGGGNEWIDLDNAKASSQVLSEKEIKEFSNIIIGIENHYGFPCDIEWAYEGGKFYITQSRPITTLSKKEEDSDVSSEIKLDELANNLKKVDWDIQRFNAYPFYISSVATFSGFKLPWGVSYTHFLCISHNKNTQWYYDKSDYACIGEIFWNKIKTVEDLEDLISQYHKTYSGAVNEAVYNENGLKNLSISELKDLLHKQSERMYASVNLGHLIESASYVAEIKLRNEYNIDPQSIQPTDLSFLKKATIYAHELCSTEKDQDVILKKFREKYAWVQSSYLGRNEITIEQIHKLAETPVKHTTETYSETNAFLKILARMFSWQDERKGNILESVYLSEPVLRMLAEKLHISYESILFLLPEEISKIEDKDFQNKLNERTKLFIDYTPQSLSRLIFVGDEAQRFINNFVGKHVHEGDEIKGQVAYPGKVTGVVRVCLNMNSIENFKEGEVLVASMTRPEYIPSMKKAIAFITNEGGITCHAAIIAREMKKPCIIGTKNATQILKDGDIVEVDANTGIVKILEKSSELNFANKNWKKNWAGGWSLLSCSYLGYQYTKQLEEALGVSIKEALHISHKGITSCYFIQEYKDAFGSEIAKRAVSNPELLAFWAKELKRTTDNILSLIKVLKTKEVSAENYNAFVSSVYEYGIYHRIIKMVPDYLPTNLLKGFLDVASESRVYAEPVYEETENYMRYMADIIAKEMNVKPEYILALTKEQFDKYLKNKILPDFSVLENQYNSGVIYFVDGVSKYFFDKKEIENIEKKISNQSGADLKGQIAFSGKVSGVARIILDATKEVDFNNGDILVTGMTRPEYIPLIQKSAGFITDAGGMLSHAAITARELKKLCIVGLENATKIIHDGDLVEVDANTGVVRILKKHDSDENFLAKNNIKPPFIYKGFHALFYPIDFVQLCWNKWGDYSGFYYKAHISAFHDSYWDLYYLPQEFTKLRNHYFNKIKNDSSFLQKHVADWTEACSKFEIILKSFEQNLNSDFDVFNQIYKEAVDVYVYEYGLSAPAQEACGFQPEQWITPKIEEYAKKYNLDFQDTFSLLTAPVVNSFITEEEIGLYDIILHSAEINKDSFDELVSIHAHNYFWVKNNYAKTDVLDKQYFVERINELKLEDKNHLKERYEEMISYPHIKNEEKKEIFKKFPPDDELALYVLINEKFAHMQDVRKSFVLKMNYYHRIFLERVSSEYEKNIDDLYLYGYHELMTSLDGDIWIDEKEISNRKKMIVAIETKDEKNIFSGDKAIELYKMLQSNDVASSTIKGIVAQKGIARGPARIVLKTHHILKVQKGDVIISSMTRPEMTSAMQKAVAFVTDEGGITCHAAIIAREMKKPCIIGTKNATKIIRDGDIVEVDANIGVVKIIG